MIRIRTAVLPIVGALLIGGMAVHSPGQTKAAGASAKPGASDPQDKAPASPLNLKLTVQIDKPNEDTKVIKMTLTLQNPTQQPVILKFATGQKYDFILQKGKGAKTETLWQWSHGMMFTQMLQNLAVKPGDKLTFTQSYAPGSNGMKPLTPGEYTLIGKITTLGKDPKPTATTTFTVVK